MTCSKSLKLSSDGSSRSISLQGEILGAEAVVTIDLGSAELLRESQLARIVVRKLSRAKLELA